MSTNRTSPDSPALRDAGGGVAGVDSANFVARVRKFDPVHEQARRFAGRRWISSLVLGLALVLPTWLVPYLRLGDAARAVSFAVAVMGVNLVVGYAGQISLGHSAFVGLGAYTTLILSGDHGWPLLLTFPAAAVLGFLLGMVVGVPALRIRGLHLGLLTLGLAAAFGPLVKRMEWLTGGPNGKGTDATLHPPTWFGTSRSATTRWSYLMIAITAAIVFALANNLVNGRIGRALGALRENDLSAITFGVPVSRYKVLVFGSSAAVAAVAGSMLMLIPRFTNDTFFTPTLSFTLYTAVFIGGIGTIAGSIVGGLLIVIVPFVFDKLGFSLDTGLLYGAALVAITLFAPDGLVGLVRRRRSAVG